MSLWLLPVLLLAAFVARAAETAVPDRSIEHAFARLYSFDFPGTHAILDRHLAEDSSDPLAYSVRAAAYLFSELDRLGVLEAEFLTSDRRITDKKKDRPNPQVKADLLKAIGATRQRAEARLAQNADDRRALLSLCIAMGVQTDYAALIEKRQFGSLSYAKQSQTYAARLLKLDPAYYDAYLTAGVSEYLLGSMPFFLRWFIKFDNVQGSKPQAIENLELVARSGQYLRPFAKILLAIIYLREKRPRDSQRMLREFEREYPENPLVRKELVRLGADGS